MRTLRVIFGDQLSRGVAALRGVMAGDTVFLAEVMEECTYVPHHPQKIVLVLSAMRHFAAALDSEISRARRRNGELSLLIADVDFFKRYNDALGHQRGDECLQRVALVLKETFRRPGELPARYGGEEFAVILPNCGPDLGETQAERLRSAMERAGIVHPSSDVAPSITLSIGIASGRVQADITPEVLIRAADNALYRSKAEGRNRVTAVRVGSQDRSADSPSGTLN